jgi:hypothetical protein
MVKKQQKPRPVIAIISFFPTEVTRGFVGRFISSSNTLNLLEIRGFAPIGIMALVKCKKFHPSTICRSYGADRAGRVKMMGELVLNEVEGKEVFTISLCYFRSLPNIPASILPF